MTARRSFTQAEVERVMRAMKAVGETVGSVDIRPDGSFRVLTGREVEQQATQDPFEVWERARGGDRAA